MFLSQRNTHKKSLTHYLYQLIVEMVVEITMLSLRNAFKFNIKHSLLENGREETKITVDTILIIGTTVEKREQQNLD